LNFPIENSIHKTSRFSSQRKFSNEGKIVGNAENIDDFCQFAFSFWHGYDEFRLFGALSDYDVS
jgi:hypothetical protein